MKSVLEKMLFDKISKLKKQGIHGQKILNIVKGDLLHSIILDFIYSHKVYKKSVMYGGSALRIVYGLPRMSVDLDFQIGFSFNLEGFEKAIIDYFKDKYGYSKLGVNTSCATEKDTIVVWITFSDLDKFKIPGIGFTKLKVRLDFNKFDTDSFQQTLISIRSEYGNFILRTYSESTLMASKIAAVLNRTKYDTSDGGNSVSANYKGRDIYDLIWYLQRGVIPNLRYLKQRGNDYKSYPGLFKRIKERLGDLGDGGRALRVDLAHLYLNPDELDEWMNEWDELFIDALQKYSDIKIEELKEVKVMQGFDTDNFIFEYYFKTDRDKKATFRIEVSETYIEDFPIRGFKRDDIRFQIASGIDDGGGGTILEYASLFYSKIEDFLKRTSGISPQLKIRTKLVVYSHGDYDPDTTVSFANKELEACQFEDLL